MKKLLITLMLMALLCSAALAESPSDRLGKPLADFTVDTIDGGTFVLSEALADHDVVLINLFASWCGPCAMEFPFMNQAFEQYSDRVAVLALSVEPKDTPEVLKAYADGHGMTFPVGSDALTGLADDFSVMTIPTSIVVDRFGNVALVESGAQTSALSFTTLFDWFLSDDYTETAVLDAFPTPKHPDAADEAALSAGGALAFRNPTDDAEWPMLPTEDGGRAALVSTNVGANDSTSAVYATVTAAGGDALAFDFKTSLQPAFDALFVQVDGDIVKRFTGDHDWTAWAVPLSAGEHEIALGCAKWAQGAAGEDRVWISNARLISGAEAEALIPVPPVSDSFSVSLNVPGARAIAFDDPDDMLDYFLGAYTSWIVSDEAVLDVTLSAREDPETAFVSSRSNDFTLSGREKPDGTGYEVRLPIGEDDCEIALVYPGTSNEQLRSPETFLLFNGEGGADAFTQYFGDNGIDISWHYAE